MTILSLIAPHEINSATLDEWESIFAVNVRGVFLCYKAAAAQMIKQGRGGRIIGASSVAGKRALGNITAYSSAKFAVRGLTQAAADDLAKHKITVNAYAPGWIQTDLLRDVQGHRIRKGISHNSPPTGEPEDIAGLVSYLVSEESKFITGQTLSINGGTFYD